MQVAGIGHYPNTGAMEKSIQNQLAFLQKKKEMKLALERRTANRADNVKLVDQKLSQIMKDLMECDEADKKLNRRLDFFLEDASECRQQS